MIIRFLEKYKALHKHETSTHKSGKHGEHLTNAFNGDVCYTESTMT